LWLTEFSTAGLKPYLWNYQSLEATIRFDWNKSERLSQICVLEEALLGNKFHGFSTPDYSLIDAEVQPRARAIQTVRRYAERMRGFREPAYHLGIFYLAITRILSWPPESTLTNHELSRLAHCLISAALTAKKLQDWTPSRQGAHCLRIDADAMRVYVNEIERPVYGNGLDILLLLYQNQPNVVLYDEIIRQVYRFEPEKKARGLVRKAVQRLREDVEPDPNKPVFILAVPRKGYRLNMKAG
jgi:DNA-binding response OmpR family regulator